MASVMNFTPRRTAVDDIYDHLEEEILSLRMLPGDKISEAEIASQFGVSRQPVRDAFSRLAHKDLLLIRPQRATEVKRFSMREIEKSRFVRASVEKEVLLRASQNCTASDAEALNASMLEQKNALNSKAVDKFSTLDYKFHKLLCRIAKADFAFEVILSEKSKVDRLCVLGLSKEDRMPELVADHFAIAEAVKAQDAPRAIEAGMMHLSRLDETIERITATKSSYFESLVG